MTQAKTPNVYQPSPARRSARLTGLAYLGIISTGIFAEAGVRLQLVVDGDALTTATNIAGSLPLFRAGMLADLAMVSLDVAVAVGFFTMLRRTGPGLALLSAALRLTQAAVIAANLMNPGRALLLARQTPPGGPSAEAAAEVLAAMELHGLVYDLGLVFFGLSCLVLAPLLHRARLAPPALAVGLALAGLVYLLGSTVAVVHPAWSPAVDPLYGIAVIAELGLATWLLVGPRKAAEGAPAALPAVS